MELGLCKKKTMQKKFWSGLMQKKKRRKKKERDQYPPIRTEQVSSIKYYKSMYQPREQINSRPNTVKERENLMIVTSELMTLL